MVPVANISLESNRILQAPRILDEEDIDAQLYLEKEDNGKEKITPSASPSPTPSSNGANEQTTPGRNIIRFDDGDPAQPNNWTWVCT